MKLHAWSTTIQNVVGSVNFESCWRCVNATTALSEEQELLKGLIPHTARVGCSHGDAVFWLLVEEHGTVLIS